MSTDTDNGRFQYVLTEICNDLSKRIACLTSQGERTEFRGLLSTLLIAFDETLKDHEKQQTLLNDLVAELHHKSQN